MKIRRLFIILLFLLLAACGDSDNKASLNTEDATVEAVAASSQAALLKQIEKEANEAAESAGDASFTRSLLRQNAEMFQTSKDEEK